MKLAVIGFGNAGGKVADKLLWYEYQTGRSLISSILAVNSAEVDLERLEHVPDENRYLIGQTDSRVRGHGVGGDPELGKEVTREDQYELDRALDQVQTYDIDAFLVVAGLGGGTGSGGAPVFAETVRNRYETPVYGLGILPSKSEGGRASLNAARSFTTFAHATDNLILFDNDAWRGSGDSVESGYQRTNEEMAKRIVTTLSAGEVDGSQLSENAMDASDVRRTLGTGGVSTIAYAETDPAYVTGGPKGLLARFRRNGVDSKGTDAATTIKGLIRQAVRSRLTCPAGVASAERSLIIISGPPETFSRKGLESGRRWLEAETGSVEVLAGDDPRPDANTLAAVVLLSNVTDIPTVEKLQNKAVAASENIEEQAATREEEIADLLTDDDERLEPL